MKALQLIPPIMLALFVTFVAATEYSSYRTRERTACYRQAASSYENPPACTTPNAVELAVRWLISDNKKPPAAQANPDRETERLMARVCLPIMNRMQAHEAKHRSGEMGDGEAAEHLDYEADRRLFASLCTGKP